MKKGFYLEQKHREEVVSSMAKKLADHDETLVFKKKADSHHLFFFIAGFCLVAVLIIIALLPSDKPEEKIAIQKKPAAPSTPVELIETAYEQGEISANQYGAYLTDVLVRYDSIPEIYKVERPMIIPDQIYSRLIEIWGKIRPSLKDSIKEDIPQLETRFEPLEKNRQ